MRKKIVLFFIFHTLLLWGSSLDAKERYERDSLSTEFSDKMNGDGAIQRYSNHDDDEFQMYDSIIIETKNKKTLTLSVVLHKKTTYPQSTILINTIYSDVKNINMGKEWAKKGYAAVILNTRGKYLSTDPLETFENEAEDINEAIQWIVGQKWSNGKVGMIGGSYSGFSQWAAAKKLHPSLKTIVPQAAVGIGTMDFPMRNHIFFGYSLRWLNQVTNNKMTDYQDFNNTRKWNSIARNWYISGKSFRKLDSVSGKPNATFQKWLNHPEYDDFWKKMIPYASEFAAIDIPVLTITGYFDADKSGALYYFNQHLQYRKKAEHYLIIGPYDHLGAQGFIKKDVRGYTIDEAAHLNLNQIISEWFDYVLNGKPKPSFLKDKINYQVMGTNQWKHAGTLSEPDTHQLKLYLDPERRDLSEKFLKGSRMKFSTLTVDYKDRSDADELLNLKYQIIDDSLYRKNNIIFSTSPFAEDFEFSGNLSGRLKIAVNKRDVDLYISVYQLLPGGRYFMLSSNVLRASYHKGSEKRHLLIPDKKESIEIDYHDWISKKIEKGSQLILSIGVVKSPFWQINYGTGKPVNDESIDDAADPLQIKLYGDSYIEVPYSINLQKTDQPAQPD